MGKRGPKPKSAAAKQLDNPGKRPIPEAGTLNALSSIPTPPDRMGDHAKGLWRLICEQLIGQQMLSATDLVGLEIYCDAYQDYREAELDIRESGYTAFTDKGYEYQRPAVARRANAAKLIRDWSSRFGFSPLDRAGVELPIRNETPPGNDPLADSLPAKPSAPPRAK
ncbi:MAG TPA: phage terminase small subunit P27 family [Planctomycetaceae bacterium]|nr:phage terminase small subunit P27 family [Planctomycetaceae bacterium]HRF01690.1 phage terminase small subunit P27 family [Pirellulaceae bacterium]